VNLAPISVYTIIHPAKLRSGTGLTEKTKWTRIEAAFAQAQREGEEVVALFADARRCDLLFAWAPLADVRVGEKTTFSLKGVYALPGRHHKTALTTFVGKKAISPKHIRPYVPCQTPAFLVEATSHPTKWSYTLEDFEEGQKTLKVHQSRERSRELRAAKILEAGDLVHCEVCGFDFAVEYPGVGDGFIEVHHRAPLADRAPEGSKTKLEDLALVCANCHRMLHRNELISIDGLRAIARVR
jgi:hypothetical protein